MEITGRTLSNELFRGELLTQYRAASLPRVVSCHPIPPLESRQSRCVVQLGKHVEQGREREIGRERERDASLANDAANEC